MAESSSWSSADQTSNLKLNNSRLRRHARRRQLAKLNSPGQASQSSQLVSQQKVVNRSSAMLDTVLFLDIDGVLLDRTTIDNTLTTMLKHIFGNKVSYTDDEKTTAEVRLFNSHTLSNLDSLLEHNPNIRIVISSNWRFLGEAKLLRSYFDLYNFSSYIVDRTGKASNRGSEISDWLAAHPEIKRYIIFDDIDDGLSQHHKTQFIEVDRRQLLSADNINTAKLRLAMQ